MNKAAKIGDVNHFMPRATLAAIGVKLRALDLLALIKGRVQALLHESDTVGEFSFSFYSCPLYQNLVTGGKMETTISTELLELKARFDHWRATRKSKPNQSPMISDPPHWN